MAIRPSQPEIITVNSEALQTQIRDLLPSQNGFGSELQASNVIIPIIDLTSSAEGSAVGTNLQTALAFGSQTSQEVRNTDALLTSNPGFYRVFGNWHGLGGANAGNNLRIYLDDTSTEKNLHYWEENPGTSNEWMFGDFDFIVYVASGIELRAASTTANFTGRFTVRQIADSSGTLVNPVGFPA